VAERVAVGSLHDPPAVLAAMIVHRIMAARLLSDDRQNYQVLSNRRMKPLTVSPYFSDCGIVREAAQTPL
jgi:hypothetical protein